MNQACVADAAATPASPVIKVLAASSAAVRYALVALTLPPYDAGALPHSHPGQSEGCYVLAGTLAVTQGDQTVMLAQGGAEPKHALHQADWIAGRLAGRFEGSEADPRPGVEPGHVPGARNIPFTSFYREDGTFRSPDELRALFAEAGADPREPFIATCGSGVTANAIIFAAHLLGNDRNRLYDGSWSEWGADPATPKAVGPA